MSTQRRWLNICGGVAQHPQVSVYVTTSKGVGGGAVVNGGPFHGNCIEGLASGTAMHKILQRPAEILADDHPAWDIQVQVLAKMCHNLPLYSLQKIAPGGGVMNKPGLLDSAIRYIQAYLNNYFVLPDNTAFGDLISLPGLGQRSGLFGALVLAQGTQI